MKNNYNLFFRRGILLAMIFLFPLSLSAQRNYVLIDNFDVVGEWASGLPTISINTEDQQEGEGCLEVTGGTNEQKFRKLFSVPVDITKGGEIDTDDAELRFWMYVSDISKLTNSNGQIELGSGGGPDQNEWNWSWGQSQIKEGWNEYVFDLSSHGGSGGALNPTAVNWFRMYFFTNAESSDVIYRLDNMRVVSKSLVKIDRLVLQVNDLQGVKISWNELGKSVGGKYEIEHSTNGVDFTSLVQIPVKSDDKSYEYIDNRELSGFNYYRLKYITDDETVVLATEYLNLQGGDSSKSVIGKVITGYQGWFNFSGDGTPLNWRHWFAGDSPNPNKITFEVYPDISEYEDSDLATPSQLTNFGDGRPAKLFSSYKENVIERHMKWMKEYEIDGAALQRFMSYTQDNRRGPSDSIAVRMGRAAEKYDRIFYIMWDMGASDTDVTRLKADWTHLVNDLNITDFSSYARQYGKPVVCIWGIGLNSRTNSPTNSLEMINWLKEQGCYVIGGVPADWRTSSGDSHPGYEEVYKALDMVMPWWVGRIRANSVTSNETNRLKPDLAYCKEHGLEYQPLIFPGFAWSQWKSGNTVNDYPRQEGRFAWEQFKCINNAGIKNLYLAMFDEYDEGTAWMKNATDFTEIPTNQYFLTASADGYWLSSDYQLRVARQMSLVMKGTEDFTSDLSIPHSLGPVYYRNSFEKRESSLSKNGNLFNLDPCFLRPSLLSGSGVTRANVTNDENALAKSGKYLARITGTASENSSYYYKFGEAKIEVKEGMTLTFSKYAVNELGLNTTVSLRFSDGTFLHNLELKDMDGIGVNPKNARGEVGQWTRHLIELDQDELIGKTITALILGYEGIAPGVFDAYFDDLIIQDGYGKVSIPSIALERLETSVGIYPTYVIDGILTVDASFVPKNELLNVSVFSVSGICVFKKEIQTSTRETLFLDIPRGVYIVSVTGNTVNVSRKIVVE